MYAPYDGEMEIEFRGNFQEVARQRKTLYVVCISGPWLLLCVFILNFSLLLNKIIGGCIHRKCDLDQVEPPSLKRERNMWHHF